MLEHACAHSQKRQVAALIIENAFLSIPLLVRDFPQPFASLSFLCTQRWPSIERIQKIPKSVSILMLGGDDDQVIPPKHLQGLWEGAKLRPEADGTQGAGHTPSGSEHDPADPALKERHKRMDSEGHFMGCLPSAAPSLRKKFPTKGGADILKSLNVMSGDIELRNGKDRYRLFAYGRHGASIIPCVAVDSSLIVDRNHLSESGVLAHHRRLPRRTVWPLLVLPKAS
jgi:uncharacterized protein